MIRTRRISSVAYADELIASELKMARAFFLASHSPISSSLASGRPKTRLRPRKDQPAGLREGMLAASLATIWPGPV